MNPTPRELPVKLSTRATSSGAAAAADATIATAPATATVASRAWPALADNQQSLLELFVMAGLSLCLRAPNGIPMPAKLVQPVSRICDAHHKMSLFLGQGERKSAAVRPI